VRPQYGQGRGRKAIEEARHRQLRVEAGDLALGGSARTKAMRKGARPRRWCRGQRCPPRCRRGRTRCRPGGRRTAPEAPSWASRRTSWRAGDLETAKQICSKGNPTSERTNPSQGDLQGDDEMPPYRRRRGHDAGTDLGGKRSPSRMGMG
jgi:hypothetical protein